MLRFLRSRLVGIALSGSLAVAPVFADNTDSEEKAKAVVSRFLQGVKDKDVDGVMEVVATPWLAHGQRVVKDRTELKTLLQGKLDKFDVPKTALEFRRIIPYEKAAELVKDEATRKLLGQVLDKDGQIVLLGSRSSPPVARYCLVQMGGAAPKVVGGPYRMTYLLRPNPIPEAAAAALDKAEMVELLSLNPEPLRKKPPDDFHGWKVLGKTALRDKEKRKGLVAALRRGVEESEGVAAACFNPRHGLRVILEGKVVDFVICFECLQVQVFEGNRSLNGFLIAGSPQPAFDKALRDAGVPLAAKAAKWAGQPVWPQRCVMLFVRCAFCHKLVFRPFYAGHRAKHTALRPDGQMTEHITVHPKGRFQGSLKGVPRAYRHLRCEVATGMPEEIIRSYLVNPFLYSGGSFFVTSSSCLRRAW